MVAVLHDDEGSYEVTIDLRSHHYSRSCSQQAPCKHVFAFSAALKDMLVSDLFANKSEKLIYIDKERVEFDEPVQELDISLQKASRLDEIDIEKIRNEFIEVYNVSGDVLEETAHGILVFSQFTDMLDTMERFLKQRQQKFLRIDGSTTAKQREQRVKTFQEQKDVLYFLISLRAGGNAITLHRADTVLHLDPWWNPAVEEQATARAHRMGQKIPFLFIVFLVSKA